MASYVFFFPVMHNETPRETYLFLTDDGVQVAGNYMSGKKEIHLNHPCIDGGYRYVGYTGGDKKDEPHITPVQNERSEELYSLEMPNIDSLLLLMARSILTNTNISIGGDKDDKDEDKDDKDEDKDDKDEDKDDKDEDKDDKDDDDSGNINMDDDYEKLLSLCKDIGELANPD